MEKIQFDIPSLEFQKPTVVRNSYIELYPDYFICLYDFNSEEPIDKEDATLGVEEVVNYFKVTGLKKAIMALELSYIEKTKRWKISIALEGVSEDIRIFFKKRVDVETFHQKISKWWLSQ